MRWCLAAILAVVAAQPAAAEPYRLRGDAFVQAREPAGFITLAADGKHDSWLRAEALVWAGADEDGGDGDALVAAIRMVHPEGFGEIRAGRLLLNAGALRPIHTDGASIVGRAPWGTTVEAFAGLPVSPRFDTKAYDWLAGGRLAQSFVVGQVGVAYLHRRDEGRIYDHEIGVDLNLVPVDWLDVAARGVYDLSNPGIAEANVALWFRNRAIRVGVIGDHRSPGRILPATSLFTALGDVPSSDLALHVLWPVAPRLDIDARAGLRLFDDGEIAEQLNLRATLRTDETGIGRFGAEVRRMAGVGSALTGIRLIARIKLPANLLASLELELVRPDEPGDRGNLWPWGLASLAWRSDDGWFVAAAIEGSAGPTYKVEVDAMARVGWQWSGP